MVALEGSDRPLPPGARAVGPAPPNQILQVTLVLYGVAGAKAKHHQVDRAANKAIAAFVRANHLTIVRVSLGKLVIVVSGTSAQFSAAFRVVRTKYTSSLGTFYGHSGPVHLPQSLAKYIDGVIGLNQFPVRRIAGLKGQSKHSGKAYHPFQMASLYNFPAGADGRGQSVALIELGGGFNPSAIHRYFRKLRLPVPKISVVLVDGALNTTGLTSKGNDLEVQGDVETTCTGRRSSR